MLELNTRLEGVMEALIDQPLKTQLNDFAEKHPCEARRNGLASEQLRNAITARAARYLVKHRGTARWRGFIDQATVRQVTIDITRFRLQGYCVRVRLTSVHSEDITKLV
jgi:hypothetical protein